MRGWRQKHPDRTRAFETIRTHRNKGFVINISVDELEKLFADAIYCPICGNKLLHDYGRGRNFSSVSLDRKNNEQELSIDTVWITCLRCNTMKGTLTMENFVKHCNKIVKLHM